MTSSTVFDDGESRLFNNSKVKLHDQLCPHYRRTLPFPCCVGLDPKRVTLQENTGRWTPDEHRKFLSGLTNFGKAWKKIAALIQTRSVVQVRTHAQKYFLKMSKSKLPGGGISIIGGKASLSIAAENGSRSKSTPKKPNRNNRGRNGQLSGGQSKASAHGPSTFSKKMSSPHFHKGNSSTMSKAGGPNLSVSISHGKKVEKDPNETSGSPTSVSGISQVMPSQAFNPEPPSHLYSTPLPPPTVDSVWSTPTAYHNHPTSLSGDAVRCPSSSSLSSGISSVSASTPAATTSSYLPQWSTMCMPPMALSSDNMCANSYDSHHLLQPVGGQEGSTAASFPATALGGPSSASYYTIVAPYSSSSSFSTGTKASNNGTHLITSPYSYSEETGPSVSEFLCVQAPSSSNTSCYYSPYSNSVPMVSTSFIGGTPPLVGLLNDPSTHLIQQEMPSPCFGEPLSFPFQDVSDGPYHTNSTDGTSEDDNFFADSDDEGYNGMQESSYSKGHHELAAETVKQISFLADDNGVPVQDGYRSSLTF